MVSRMTRPLSLRADLKVATSKEQLKCKPLFIIFIIVECSAEYEYDLYMKNDYGTSGNT